MSLRYWADSHPERTWPWTSNHFLGFSPLLSQLKLIVTQMQTQTKSYRLRLPRLGLSGSSEARWPVPAFSRARTNRMVRETHEWMWRTRRWWAIGRKGRKQAWKVMLPHGQPTIVQEVRPKSPHSVQLHYDKISRRIKFTETEIWPSVGWEGNCSWAREIFRRREMP